MNKYVVSIGFRMGNYYLGAYEEIDDAIDVRKKAEALIRDKGTLFYEQWKKKADAEPDWAKEHPIRFCVTKDGEQGYLVSFAPEL